MWGIIGLNGLMGERESMTEKETFRAACYCLLEDAVLHVNC